ncbi:hypothetical protein ABZ348_11630 [Streptomyces sp. NPDC005963]
MPDRTRVTVVVDALDLLSPSSTTLPAQLTFSSSATAPHHPWVSRRQK